MTLPERLLNPTKEEIDAACKQVTDFWNRQHDARQRVEMLKRQDIIFSEGGINQMQGYTAEDHYKECYGEGE